MFNRCWRWRVLLARRSDGTISRSQWGSLQDHLVSCSSCRKLAEADEALQATFNYASPRMSQENAAAFDNRVVAMALSGTLRSVPQPSGLSGYWKRIRTQARALPLGFLAQLGSGAVLAVTLTSFFLLPALHSHSPVSARAAQLLEIQAQDRENAEASIPMESLLQTPTPRAALLWTNPQPGSLRHKARLPDLAAPIRPAQPGLLAPPKPNLPGKAVPLHHSALPSVHAFG